eukprot:scaffold169934_cov19-Tisochrysis_lutea.AAC.1
MNQLLRPAVRCSANCSACGPASAGQHQVDKVSARPIQHALMLTTALCLCVLTMQTTVDLLERAAEYASRAPSTAPGSVLAALDAAIGSSPTPSTPSYELARAQLQQHAHVLSTTSSASTASAPEAAAAKAAAVAAASAPKSPSSVGAGGAAGGTQPRAVRDPFSPGGGAVSPRSPTSAAVGFSQGRPRQYAGNCCRLIGVGPFATVRILALGPGPGCSAACLHLVSVLAGVCGVDPKCGFELCMPVCNLCELLVLALLAAESSGVSHSQFD